MSADSGCPWQRHWDEESGSYYYFDPTTEASEWDIPLGWEDHFAKLDAKEAAASSGGDGVADAVADADGSTRVGEGEQEEAFDSSSPSRGEHQALEDEHTREQEPQDINDVDHPAGDEEGEDARRDGVHGKGAVEGEGFSATPSISSPSQEDDHDGAEGLEGDTGEEQDRPPEHAEDSGHALPEEPEHGPDDVHSPPPAELAPAAPATCAWTRIEDESGDVFFYNEATEESSWDEPAEYTRFHAAAQHEDVSASEALAGPGEDEAIPEANSARDADGPRTPSPFSSPEEERVLRGSPRAALESSSAQQNAHESTNGSSAGLAAAARSASRRSRKSPSPDVAVSGSGGVSFPSFGEDYSPKEERHGEEGSPAGSPGDEASSSFGASPSPSRGVNSASGFAVGELSPILENGATSPTRAAVKVEVESAEVQPRIGKENEVEISHQQKVQDAEEDVVKLERRLEERDAIMEVDFHARVTAYQSALRRLKTLKGEAPNNKESLNHSVKKLIAGYHGYAQQVALVNNWLQLATDGGADTESTMVQELKGLIKKNFDAKKADALLDSGSGVPTWLTAMQADDGWRRTLIELAREHRGSALLRFVLKQLSDRGHHREIAAVISETDLFSVFKGVLKDALARIPADDEVDIAEALGDLKRMCCSTSYMFMYSQQLLIDLEAAAVVAAASNRKRGRDDEDAGGASQGPTRQQQPRAKKKTRSETSTGRDAGEVEVPVAVDAESRAAAARKYKRLRQELAKHMCESSMGERDSASSGERSGSASGRPSVAFVRGIEQALLQGAGSLPRPGRSQKVSHVTASDAVVSLLRHAGGAGTGGSGEGGSGAARGGGGGGSARRTAVLSEAVETLVTAFGLEGARVAASAGPSPQPTVDSGSPPQASLVRHSTVMNILLEALFHPALRSPSEDVKTGCCAILAYASCVEVADPSSSSSGTADEADRARDAVDAAEMEQTSHALMQAAKECFTMRPSHQGSLQERLFFLVGEPLVGLGVLKWIHAQVSKDSFCSTPSFLSYAPMFLQLCGRIAEENQTQRPDVFEILKLMLSARTAPDTPPASRTKLKQQVLLRMTELMVYGYVLPVLAFFRKLAAGPGLDQPLISFFIYKVVGVAVPRKRGTRTTYSPVFLNTMAGLLGVPRVRQALQGNLLTPQERERLNSYARFCLKFQSKDLTQEALESIKLLQSGLERA